MLTYKISFTSAANRGSFLVDAIAHTIGGDWIAAGCTDDFGTIKNVPDENESFADELLEEDERVESYRVECD